MREDGQFHDFINEPKTFIEANLTPMLASSISRAVICNIQNPACPGRKLLCQKSRSHRLEPCFYRHFGAYIRQ